MSDLLDQCKQLYGTKDLYQIFEVSKGVTDSKLKKAYYKISLKVHPDKVDGKDKAQATEKFQLLSKLYNLLSDKKKRGIYDKTGELDVDDDFGVTEWIDYWRELFPTVTVDQINQFQSEFQGSEEELEALKAAYVTCKGDMAKIVESVLCATIEDEQRFREIFNPLIDSEELPTYKKYSSESAASKKKRQSKAKKEAKEATAAAKELKGGSLEGYNDLALALQHNREKRGGILSYLEEKYCNEEGDSDDLSFDTKPAKKRTKSQSKSASTSSQTKRRRKN